MAQNFWALAIHQGLIKKSWISSTWDRDETPGTCVQPFIYFPTDLTTVHHPPRCGSPKCFCCNYTEGLHFHSQQKDTIYFGFTILKILIILIFKLCFVNLIEKMDKLFALENSYIPIYLKTT